MTQTREGIANQLEQDARFIASDHPAIAGNMIAAAAMLRAAMPKFRDAPASRPLPIQW